MEKSIVEPFFRKTSKNIPQPDILPLSSQAFGTPVHPIRPNANPAGQSKPSILPVLLAPATLRPLAFRVITKKHGLTLASSALQLLATFIGRHCGLGWREDGLAEKVLDEAAKSWKKNGGGLIVEGDGDDLRKILSNLDASISGGRVSHQDLSDGQATLPFVGNQENVQHVRPAHLIPGVLTRQDSLGLSKLDVNDKEESHESRDPRKWLKTVGAFDQPTFIYNNTKKHFELVNNTRSLLPDPSHKTRLFRNRYNLIHQRLLRNESFQTSTVYSGRTHSLQRSSSLAATAQQAYKLTPIANLLGRSGSSHILLGLLTISPIGLLTLTDVTGSIVLEMQHARPAPEDGAWVCPGMIVLVDGMYEAEGSTVDSELDGKVGVGGTVGGRFIAFSVGGPPCERRDVTLGVSLSGAGGNTSAGGGFGWVDFLGVGSEKASGPAMRELERNVLREDTAEATNKGRGRMVILGEVTLNDAKTLQALSKILSLYAVESAEQTPMVFVLIGNFAHYAVMSGGSKNGSVEYKEYFDALALTLSEYPTMLQTTTFIFVPGNNDPWASSFSAGAATPIPQANVPDLFTSRVRRAFATANADAARSTGNTTTGEAVWTTNPTRISLFGPAQEIAIFRDDMLSRLRRNALRFRPLEKDWTTKHEDSTTEPGSNTTEEIDLDAEDKNREVDSAVESAESRAPVSRTNGKSATAISLDSQAARKLVKTVLDQGYLSPFPLSIRPVLWDYAGALQLYPLPTALILMDVEAPPFAVSYQGCLVMNPGALTAPSRKNMARWMEYGASTKQGTIREARI